MKNRAVIVFLRAPEKGRVKTRLSRCLSDTFVLNLYKAFVEDTLAAINKEMTIHLYFWPPEKKAMLCRWLDSAYRFAPQRGDDLGQKMANAFKDTFSADVDQALLIGTDIPQLDSNIIFSGFQLLGKKPAVLGPSKDGGYYLIGFNKQYFTEKMFRNVSWSTPKVLDQTLAMMKQVLPAPGFLPVLNDVDTPEDVENLIKDMKKGCYVGPKTRQLLTSDDC